MRIQPINNHTYYRNNYIKNTNFNGFVTPRKNNSFLKYSYLCTLAAIVSLGVFYDYKTKEYLEKDIEYVLPLQEKFSNKEDALNYAKNQIAEYLNLEHPKEYGVTIGIKRNGYETICECIGDSSSVLNTTIGLFRCDQLGIPRPYIKLHGHPKDNAPPKHIGTQTFSFQDFISFNNDFNCKETYVVNKDKQHCVLSKKDNYKKLDEDELAKIEQEFNDAFNSSWSNPVKIIKDEKVIHTVRDYQAMHRFWDGIAKKYNLEYKTTYGTFDGIDAYEKSYYPEFENKFENE